MFHHHHQTDQHIWSKTETIILWIRNICVHVVCVCVFATDRCTYLKREAFHILESKMYKLKIFNKCYYYPKFQVFRDMTLCHWACCFQHWTVLMPSFWLSGSWMRPLGLLDPEDEGSRIGNFLPTAWHHATRPDLPQHCCENLKPHMLPISILCFVCIYLSTAFRFLLALWFFILTVGILLSISLGFRVSMPNIHNTTCCNKL